MDDANKISFSLEQDGDVYRLWWTHECSTNFAPPGEPADHTAKSRLPLGGEGWTLEQADPLTVSPSILWHSCGTHGFIREGQWVSV